MRIMMELLGELAGEPQATPLPASQPTPQPAPHQRPEPPQFERRHIDPDDVPYAAIRELLEEAAAQVGFTPRVPSGYGDPVEVAVQGRMRVFDAKGERPGELKTGTHIRVVRVIEGDTLIVPGKSRWWWEEPSQRVGSRRILSPSFRSTPSAMAVTWIVSTNSGQ